MSPNERRRQRAAEALKCYIYGRGEVFENSLSEMSDLIADLCHLAMVSDEKQSIWDATHSDSIIRMGQLHFFEEFENPEEDAEESDNG